MGELKNDIREAMKNAGETLTEELAKGIVNGGFKIDELKFDSGKARLALVPPLAIKAIGAIMTYGLVKYDESSWKKVEAWRYRDALMRHLCEYLEDPHGVDEESGLPHLWHLITNAAFLCELEDPYLKSTLEERERRLITPEYLGGKE